MLGNTFGRIFRVTTCGESYGIGKGSGLAVIVDGVPPGLRLTKEFIQKELDKRKPGHGKLNSPRKETDRCDIFAGIGQDGVTTGAPVGIIIYNVDTQKVHIDQYRAYRDIFRPGHATYSFFLKYGEAQDWCGAGRSSGRETVGRVAGGAVAKFILQREKIEVLAYTKECMGIRAKDMTWEAIKKNYRKNEINCPDIEAAVRMEKKVLEIKDEGDTAGGIIELIVHNVPPGLGEPVFDKLIRSGLPGGRHEGFGEQRPAVHDKKRQGKVQNEQCGRFSRRDYKRGRHRPADSGKTDPHHIHRADLH